MQNPKTIDQDPSLKSQGPKKVFETKPKILEKRNSLRLNLSRIQFKDLKNGKIYSVIDFSISGMSIRIIDPEQLNHFGLGHEVSGVLNYEGQRVYINLSVKNWTKDRIGLEFKDTLELNSRSLISSWISAEQMGPKLRPIPTANRAQIWYQGPFGLDLTLSQKTDGTWNDFEVAYGGRLLQWTDQSGVTTGVLTDLLIPSETQGVMRTQKQKVDWQDKVDELWCKWVIELIAESVLPKEFKEGMIRKIKMALL